MYDILVHLVLIGLGVLLVTIEVKHKLLPKTAQNADFRAFQIKYLTVYLGAILADWLQGPYLYRLYDHYGYLPSQIGALYIAGYLSAMISGPVVGGMADRQGRKKMCLWFCGIYALSCLLQMYPSFLLLLLGRVLGGISTSLLMVTFESWMIFEHHKAGFPSDWLPRTFSLATFGNGVTAVAAGIVANWIADSNKDYHPRRPFQLAIFVLMGTAAVLHRTWTENVAPEETLQEPAARLAGALRPILRNKKIWLLALVQTFFESAMYTFVFLWTPSLAEHHYHAPLGYIFATFMLAIVCGSTLFQMALSTGHYSVSKCLDMCLVAAAVCFIVAFLFEGTSLLYLSFVGFELCCGVYYPAVASLRGEVLPEEHRAGIMGWFRVPLNILVVLLLFTNRVLTHHYLFLVCAVLCLLGLLMHRRLEKELGAEKQAADVEQGTGFVQELNKAADDAIASPARPARPEPTAAEAMEAELDAALGDLEPPGSDESQHS